MTTKLEIPKIVIYSDINPDVHISSPFEVVFNEEAIKKSLEAIFTTPYGSRPFRRRFGTKLLDLMWEPVDDRTASKLETMLRDTATMWETRIDRLVIRVLPDAPNQQYYVEMSYGIPNLGDKLVSYKFNMSK